METNERYPLLSDDHIYGRPDARYVRNFYEAKITSGELAVAKTATKGNGVSPWCCSECGLYLGRIDDPNFCHGCGAKIVEG